MKGSRFAAFAAGLLLVASCTGGSDDSDSASDSDPGEPACGAPPFATPPDVDSASCRWLTDAEEIVGFHDLVLATFEESRGRFRMVALDPATGEALWQTDPLFVLTDDPDFSEPNDQDRSLEVVHWQGQPYASFEYMTQPEGLADPRAAVTFVPLADGATPTPVTWVSPSADTVVHNEHVQADDVTLAMTENGAAPIDQVIDPTTGRTTAPLRTDPLEVLQAVGDGWFAESYGTWGWTFLVRDYDGSLRWDASDHVPDGANRGGYRYVVGAYGDYLIAMWDKPGPFSTDGPWLLVVHDKDGNVVAQADYGTTDSISQNRVVASPNEQWIVVDSTGVGNRPVAVDLAEGTATTLPGPLAPLSVTDAGVVYGVESADASRPMSVDGTTGETLWTGPPTSRVPSAVVGNVALVGQTDPAVLVGGQVYEDVSDVQPRTVPTWALAAAPAPEPTDEPTPDHAAQAARFAPLVRLAIGEPNTPMDASTFVENSQLWWDHGEAACRKRDVVAEDPEAAKLGAGAYSHRGLRSEVVDNEIVGCDHTGRTYTTNEGGHDGAGSQGFFLDLDDAWRDRGAEVTDGGLVSPTYWQYYDHGDGTGAYVYWLFYPYNDYGPLHEVKNRHEGDWERVAVRVEGETPVGVTYWHHQSSETCFLPWDEVEDAGGRPVAYAAKGSHGSYPMVGKQVRDNVPDDVTSKGAGWSTWEMLQPVEEQDWWDYRGLWGDISSLPHHSGVAGPFEDRNLSDAVTTDLQCAAPGNPEVIDERFLGEWVSQGPVDQPSSTTEYRLSMTLRQGTVGGEVGTSFYPGLGCGGDLRLRQVRPGTLILREEIVYREDDCVDTVRMTLTLDGERLRYHVAGGGVTASAVLVRP